MAMGWRSGITLLVFLVLLVRCGGGALEPTTPSLIPTTQAAPRITLTLWHGESATVNEALQRLMLDYQRDPKHPNIEIRIEAHGTSLLRDYKNAILAGGPPDIVLLTENRWIGPLADQQLLLDLSSMVTEDDQAAILPAALDGARFGGKLYGLPFSLDLPVLYYNRANVVSDQPLAETATWFDFARDFSDASAQQGLAYNLSLYFTYPYLAAFGGRPFNQAGDVILGTESFTPTVQWLSWLRDLSQDETLLARDDNRLINQAIQQNTAIMTVDWARNVAAYRQIWGDGVGIGPLPRLSQTGQEPQPLVRSSVLAINPRSSEQQQTAARDVIRFLVGGQAQSEMRRIDLPSVRRDVPEDDPIQSKISLAASHGAAWPTDLQFNKAWDVLTATLRRSLSGDSIESAVLEAEQRLRNQ